VKEWTRRRQGFHKPHSRAHSEWPVYLLLGLTSLRFHYLQIVPSWIPLGHILNPNYSSYKEFFPPLIWGMMTWMKLILQTTNEYLSYHFMWHLKSLTLWPVFYSQWVQETLPKCWVLTQYQWMANFYLKIQGISKLSIRELWKHCR
jgi:hypothetical protein